MIGPESNSEPQTPRETLKAKFEFNYPNVEATPAFEALLEIWAAPAVLDQLIYHHKEK